MPFEEIKPPDLILEDFSPIDVKEEDKIVILDQIPAKIEEISPKKLVK